jgi:hypothetical protein
VLNISKILLFWLLHTSLFDLASLDLLLSYLTLASGLDLDVFLLLHRFAKFERRDFRSVIFLQFTTQSLFLPSDFTSHADFDLKGGRHLKRNIFFFEKLKNILYLNFS